jgi:pimeloyl-ACP methyl ester carboxylesterase
MARRYAEVMPDPDVVMLADDIGHWPQLEASDAVLTHFLAHIGRIAWLNE